MRIIISEFMDASAVARLKNEFDTVYDPQLIEQPDQLAILLKNADALIVRNRTQVNRDLIAAAARLKVVGRLGVGLDNIDLDACEAGDIKVIPATGANAQAVAEYVIGSAMVLLRGCYQASAQIANGDWPRTALSQGRELTAKTLGLVGFGNIGQATARLAQAIGMTVLAHDALLKADTPVLQDLKVGLVELPLLLATADVVSLHLPLTQSTHGLINNDALASMQQGAILINTSRGGIVDEVALAGLLKHGHLGGAALDVFECEPLPGGSPLADAPNLILTPHVAGVTLESNQRVSDMIADQVATFLSTH